MRFYLPKLIVTSSSEDSAVENQQINIQLLTNAFFSIWTISYDPYDDMVDKVFCKHYKANLAKQFLNTIC